MSNLNRKGRLPRSRGDLFRVSVLTNGRTDCFAGDYLPILGILYNPVEGKVPPYVQRRLVGVGEAVAIGKLTHLFQRIACRKLERSERRFIRLFVIYGAVVDDEDDEDKEAGQTRHHGP